MLPKYRTGIAPNISLDHDNAIFDADEKRIVNQFANDWFISFAKTQLFKNVRYAFVFAKPSEELKEKFLLGNEMLVLFLNSPVFQNRMLDFVDKTLWEYRNRLDIRKFILISKDERIKEEIAGFIKTHPESRIIIPYSYSEWTSSSQNIWDRLKEQFFGRDLFAFESPLTNETYFFGREDIIKDLYLRYEYGQHSGLFGLRKIGKTSVLNALLREMSANGDYGFYLTAEDTAFQERKWYEALGLLVETINEKMVERDNINIHFDVSSFTALNASIRFREYLQKVHGKIGQKRILIILDEIDKIAFGTATKQHWKNGEDFLSFWQTLRSVSQQYTHLFTVLIAGTNPTLIETPKVSGTDNPIYRWLTPTYLSLFDKEKVKQMVSTISSYMGLSFDDDIFTYLKDDYGGHPFLVRQVCSLINKKLTQQRPQHVPGVFYQSNKELFIRNLKDYNELILQVLRDWYPEEYKHLELLALDDYAGFLKNSDNGSSHTIEHLLGYNIIDKYDTKFYIKIKSITDFIKVHSEITKKVYAVPDKRGEVSAQRNQIEERLRQMVKLILKANYGVTARDEFLKIVPSNGSRKEKLAALNIDEVFSGEHELYFEDLRLHVSKNWDDYKHVFNDKELCDLYLRIININRKADAHAGKIDEISYEAVLFALNWVKQKMDKYFN